MPENINKEKLFASSEIAQGKSNKYLGGGSVILGAALDSKVIQVETMDLVKVFDVWSGTWHKNLPLTAHPVRDAFDTAGYDFFHTLSHEGFPAVAGLFLIGGGLVTLAKGIMQERMGKDRFHNA